MKRRSFISSPPFFLFLFLCIISAFAPLHISCSKPPSLSDPNLHKALRDILSAALEANPDLQVPGLTIDPSTSTAEKATLLTLGVLALGDADLEEWLKDNAELLALIQKLKNDKGKVKRMSKIRDFLVKLGQKIADKLKLAERKKDCRILKDKGITPEMRLGHSPIKLVGYPVFDVNTKRTVLERRFPLNIVSGYLVPIKVGAEDYMLQGRVEKIKKFLYCFGDYGVIGQTLFPDEHWRTEPYKGMQPQPLYVQLQGTIHWGTPGEVAARHTLMRVLRAIDDATLRKIKMAQLVDQLTEPDVEAGDVLQMLGPVAAAKQLMSYTTDKMTDFKKLLEEVAEAPTIKQKITVLFEYFERHVGGEEWTQPHVIASKKMISLTITTYPRPDSTVRSTRNLGTNKATLGDIARVLDEINFE